MKKLVIAGSVGIIVEIVVLALIHRPAPSSSPPSSAVVKVELARREAVKGPALASGLESKDKQEKLVSLEDLELLNAFVLNNRSQALIRIKSTKKSAIYQLNDCIGDACIISIYLDHVVFLQNGQRKMVWIKEDINKAPLQKISPYEILVNKTQLAREIKSLNELAASVQLMPYIEKGKITGFKLAEIKGEQGRIVKMAGLEKGDIIRSINGSSFNDIKETARLLETIRKDSPVQIEVEVERKCSGCRRTSRRRFTYITF